MGEQVAGGHPLSVCLFQAGKCWSAFSLKCVDPTDSYRVIRFPDRLLSNETGMNMEVVSTTLEEKMKRTYSINCTIRTEYYKHKGAELILNQLVLLALGATNL